MDFDQPTTAGHIARRIGARLIGEESLEIKGINEIHQVRSGDITFADVEKYFAKALKSEASA
ncbi:MAG: UDP-3-O-(3-hydroxymyristoyl)glucosamine N-acyltransferase, partial [Saprospiraceae bacterium]|nr:UDP-3-O-(3-hydroxymyristoyl)glucosamine N-acyltransferase [Saprospiraceae bacterium]